MTDLDVPPSTSVWARLKKSISGVGDVSIRGDVDANNPDTVDLDVRASAYGTDVQLTGQAGEQQRKKDVFERRAMDTFSLF